MLLLADLQKLEREARICRMLKHPNIGTLRAGRVIPTREPQPNRKRLCSAVLRLLTSMSSSLPSIPSARPVSYCLLLFASLFFLFVRVFTSDAARRDARVCLSHILYLWCIRCVDVTCCAEVSTARLAALFPVMALKFAPVC